MTTTEDRLRQVAVVTAGLAGAIGVLGIMGWASGASTVVFVPRAVTIVPFVAVAVLLLALSLVSLVVVPSRRPATQAVRIVAAALLLVTILSLLRAATGIPVGVEGRLLGLAQRLIPGLLDARLTPPLSGVCVALLSLALLLFASGDGRRFAGLSASVAAAMGGIVCLGYAYAAPLFFHDYPRLVALPGGVAFLLLGTAIVAAAGPDSFPLSTLVGSSTQTILLRRFLPVTIGALLLVDWITTRLLAGTNPALVSALSALLVACCVAAVVVPLARTVGDKLDRSLIAARESEAKWRTLAESIPEKVFVKDRAHRFLSINKPFARDLGIRPVDVVGKADADFFPKNLADKYWADDARIMETGESEELEERYLQDGRETWVRTLKAPVRDENGGIVGICGVFSDITERKRALEVLRANEERFRLAAESVSDVVYEWDLKAALIWYGDVDSLMGYPAGGFPRTLDGWAATLHPDDLPKVWAAIDGQLRGAAPYDLEYRIAAKDGGWRWWSARGTALRDELGEPSRWIGAVTDITERRKSHEALRESETRLRELTESLPQLIWTCRGDDGTCDYLSPQWVAYTGIPEAEQLGFRWLEQLHPDDRDPTVARWTAAAASGSVFDAEFRIRRSDGVHRWFKTRALPLRDGEGRLVKWFGTSTDIEDQKGAEEQLRKALAGLTAAKDEVSRLNEGLERRVGERTADLNAINAELEAFTYSVSHDLRAPLRQADGFAKILLDDYGPKLDDQALHYLEQVRQGTRFMGQLIDELLSFSRLGRRELVRQTVGLDKVLQEAIEDLKPAVEGRRIEWHIGRLPWVECDPAMMRQVFINLLSNAIKFTRPRAGAVIEVGSAAANGCPEVFVRDNGVGFSMKYADKLFTVFQRLHRQEDFEGTGIGLAIVQRIIHKHGGRVWAESEVDKGSTFHFTLSAAGGEQ